MIAAEAAQVSPSPAATTNQSQAKPHFGAWGVDLSSIDARTHAGDDFFRYVNGDWYDKAAIPNDRTSTGSFQDLQIQSEDEVRAIVNGLESKTGQLTPDEQKVRDLYHSFVDTAHIEQLGLAPAQPVLTAIAGIRTPDDVARMMGSRHWGTRSLFRAGIAID